MKLSMYCVPWCLGGLQWSNPHRPAANKTQGLVPVPQWDTTSNPDNSRTSSSTGSPAGEQLDTATLGRTSQDENLDPRGQEGSKQDGMQVVGKIPSWSFLQLPCAVVELNHPMAPHYGDSAVATATHGRAAASSGATSSMLAFDCTPRPMGTPSASTVQQCTLLDATNRYGLVSTVGKCRARAGIANTKHGVSAACVPAGAEPPPEATLAPSVLLPATSMWVTTQTCKMQGCCSVYSM
jgi:hypothetical protein